MIDSFRSYCGQKKQRDTRLLLGAFISLILGAACTQSPAEEAYFKALRLAKEGGSLEQVLEQINKAVALEPKNPEYRKSRGMYYFDNGRYAEALTDLSTSVETSDLGQAYRFYLKGLTEGKLGQYDQALKDFQQAKQLAPMGDQFYGGLALAHLALKQPQLALEDINRAQELAPKFERWKYVKAMVLACLMRKEESIQQFSQAVVYSRMGSDNVTSDVHFDGEREFRRVEKCSPAVLSSHWHYGGKWLPEGVFEEYRR